MIAPDQRRRVAVALVAIVAAAATIATSQAVPEARLEQSSGAAVVLDAGAPRAIARFVLTISPEALSGSGSPTGTVTFTIEATNRVGDASTISGEPVEISATVVGNPQPPQMDGGSPYWSIGELCKPAEPCRREFDVSVEWLQPRPDRSVRVSVGARLLVTYFNETAEPGGASAAWQAGEFSAIEPAPSLSAQVDLGGVSLGRDSPLAARHVLLRGSAAILADPSAVDFTADVRLAPSGGPPPPAILSLVADDSTAQPVSAGDIIQPFAGCPPAKECVRGFTVLARWSGFQIDARADIEWRFEALARFPGATGIPDDATLTAEVDHAIDLGPQSPRLRAQAEGSFDLQAAGDRTSGRLKLQVSAPAFGDAFLGAGVFIPGYGWLNLALANDGTDLRTATFPLMFCTDIPPCVGTIELFVESTAARDATISWQVTIDLPVPRAELAVGQLGIEIVDDP